MNGTENLSVKLRYLTCLNLVNNYSLYNSYPQSYGIRSLSPTYVETCFDSATIGAYSCAWTVLGLCDVIMRPIRVIYTPFNGKKDLAYKTLNTVFEPCIEKVNDTPLSVIWYGIGALPTPGIPYSVNHFATVFSVAAKISDHLQSRMASATTDINSETTRKDNPTALNTVNTPVARPVRHRRKRVSYTPEAENKKSVEKADGRQHDKDHDQKVQKTTETMGPSESTPNTDKRLPSERQTKRETPLWDASSKREKISPVPPLWDDRPNQNYAQIKEKQKSCDH